MRARRAVLQLTAVLLILSVATPAHGALQSVSGLPDPAVDGVPVGGPKENVAYSLANGFPLWYQDANGLKLALCLDQSVAVDPAVIPGGSFLPCLTAEPFAAVPISFPFNFGSEAFWWMAVAFAPFTSTDQSGAQLFGDALIVMAQEAAFQNDLLVDGDQAAFGRIRIRLNVPVPGTYEVTYPYGQVTYVVPAVGAHREINQTQDVGNLLPLAGPVPPAGPPPDGDFTLALADGLVPAPPVGFNPALNAEIISDGAAVGIGPFLVPAAGPGGDPLAPIVALNGATYLTDPGTELAPIEVPVTGSPTSNNFFRIRLTDPPNGFTLNVADGSQEIVLDRFQVAGKIFDAGPNVAPVATPDLAATAKGTPVTIDVVANDVDPVGAGNVHGLNPQALGLPSINPNDLAGTILLTRPLRTANGGTVRRSSVFQTGKTAFIYTPAAGFSGIDAFEYVVQDTGGLVSAPATVTVVVEDLTVNAAEYRPRTGKWRISGTTSDGTANSITLLGAPRATLTGAAVVPPAATSAAGSATFRLDAQSITFRLEVGPLPSSEVTAAHLHLGAPGQNGPAVFALFDRAIEGELQGSKSGTLTPAEILQDQTPVTFDEVVAAILSGDAYVDLHTGSFTGGELRGQVAQPLIGTAPVDAATGAWSFSSRSGASPGGQPANVGAISANGVRVLGAPLRIR